MQCPVKEVHVREIARKLNKSPTTISKCLKKYERENLLISEKKLNHLVFKANNEGRSFKLEKLYYNLKNINDSGIMSYLERELNYPEAIGIFGSFSKGEDAEKSDIDIFIISSSQKKPDLSKYEKILKHPIHLLIFSREDVEKTKKKNPELLNNIISGIILSGKWRLFK